jgi:L-ascorbate metabolism protein UlaG (beta-lactamase superfamily)
MKIQQIRNATLIIEYAGKRILVDPMLSDKGALPTTPIPAKTWNFKRNPLHDLPIAKDEIVKGVDFVFLSHLHFDHWDNTAKEVLPKDVKIFVQDKADQLKIEKSRFTNVEVLTEDSSFGEIKLSRTKAQHGKGFILRLAGFVCGLVLKHTSEKTLYIVADTVWYEGIQEAINKHKPDILVVNGGDNQFFFGGPIIMGKKDIYEVYKAAPNATIVVSHMEGVNHNTLSRVELKKFISEKKMNTSVFVPDDGESYIF